MRRWTIQNIAKLACSPIRSHQPANAMAAIHKLSLSDWSVWLDYTE
jgi:hypothetical protein